MVAAELSRTRADHRWRMEAKVRAKAAKTPLPPVYKQDPTPLRKYGRYQLPGTGHSAGPTVHVDELEDHVIINVAGVYVALPPKLLQSCHMVCSTIYKILFYSM